MKVLPEPVASESRARFGSPLARSGRSSPERRGWRRPGSTGGCASPPGYRISSGAAAGSSSRSPCPARSGRGGRRAWGTRPRARGAGQAGEAVVLDEQVAVGGEDEGDVEALAGGVELGLLKAVGRRQVLGLGLDEGHGDRLGVRVDLDAQGVVDASLRPACRAVPSMTSMAPAVSSRRIRSSVQPRAWMAGSISLARVSASGRPKTPPEWIRSL